MKFIFPFFCLLFSASATLWAQSTPTLPEGGFENWAVRGNVLTYEEPVGTFWTTLNVLKTLGGPETVKKVSDAAVGNYAAMLRTGPFGSLIIPGILISGEVDVDNFPDIITAGKPFTGTPDRLTGYYKYTPVAGDSAIIYAALTHYNTTTSQRDTIAEASLVIYDTVSTYTSFSEDFIYSQTGVLPDTLIILAVSSGGATPGNGAGQVGSTLYVDELAFDYLNSIEDFEQDVAFIQIYPNPASYSLTIDVPDFYTWSRVNLIDLNGKTVIEMPLEKKKVAVDLSSLVPGIYACTFTHRSGRLYTKKIIVK